MQDVSTVTACEEFFLLCIYALTYAPASPSTGDGPLSKIMQASLCKRSTQFHVRSCFSRGVLPQCAARELGWKTMRRYSGFTRATLSVRLIEECRSVIFLGNVANIFRLMIGSCTIVGLIEESQRSNK